jgi:hypothetical protein
MKIFTELPTLIVDGEMELISTRHLFKKLDITATLDEQGISHNQMLTLKTWGKTTNS